MKGSPPPMRGKVKFSFLLLLAWRITPLCGGKSSVFNIFLLCHPGSPPPMRGKGAGCSTLFAVVQDHPRLCGEKSMKPEPKCLEMGSPRLCGEKVRFSTTSDASKGITPAYAGKKEKAWSFLPNAVRDHPRLCGEKRQQFQPLRQVWGSPPPMRGKD